MQRFVLYHLLYLTSKFNTFTIRFYQFRFIFTEIQTKQGNKFDNIRTQNTFHHVFVCQSVFLTDELNLPIYYSTWRITLNWNMLLYHTCTDIVHLFICVQRLLVDQGKGSVFSALFVSPLKNKNNLFQSISKIICISKWPN